MAIGRLHLPVRNFAALGHSKPHKRRLFWSAICPTSSNVLYRKGHAPVLPSAEPKGTSADLSLIAAIRAGDEDALGQLYDRYSSIVYSVALRVLSDTAGAEDVLQEVFMQLWRNPGTFDASRGNLAPWLAVIARNRAIDMVRKRRPETDIADIVVSVEQDLAGEADRSRAVDKNRGVLSTMPAVQRSALEMAFFEGLTHTEIAAKTGEALGTIKTRIRGGLLSLRKAFQT